MKKSAAAASPLSSSVASSSSASWPLSPWSKGPTTAVLGIIGVNFALSVWGLIQSFVLSYQLRVPSGNHYTGVWINAFTWVLTVQALLMLHKPSLVTLKPARLYAWAWYISWMFACCIIILFGIHYKEMSNQYAWAFLWLPPLGLLLAALVTHRNSSQRLTVTVVDVEAHPAAAKAPRPPACSKLAWRQCWCNYWAFVAWSSMFWLAFLGFFLALQAAWLVNDQRMYPAPGKLYQIDLESGSNYRPRIHMLCKGPSNSGLSTFVLEAGGGSPGIKYAAIVDQLAAAGRRACWYDRLGYGWSDEGFLDGNAQQTVLILYNTLQAAREAGPFIVAGHSFGGQLAIMFASLHPDNVTGIALLDSMDDVAISLAYTGSSYVTVTLPSGRQVARPAFTYLTADRLALVDIVRAITPLAWARFITMSSDARDRYLGAGNAVYGNNKAWQAQWLGIAAAVQGGTDASDLLSDLAYKLSNGTVANVWHGTAWPDLSPKPVLLLPAEKTLQPGMPEGCDVFNLPSSLDCQNRTLACQTTQCTYPNLYATYLRTLSSNASMEVMPGNHGYPTVSYQRVADALLQKFAGV